MTSEFRGPPPVSEKIQQATGLASSYFFVSPLRLAVDKQLL